MALDYFQMTYNPSANSYTVKLSFNGGPIADVPDLTYVPASKHYIAQNIFTAPKTVKHEANNALLHLEPYEDDELIKIYQNAVPQLVGGGIIKTTHYPPPFNKDKKYTYENEVLLSQVYLSQLTIERNTAGNYVLSGIVKQLPNGTYRFGANPVVALTNGIGNRTAEILEIRLASGNETQVAFSGLVLNNLYMDEATPCTVIVHDSPLLDLDKNYKKSGWFFIKD